MIQYLLNLTAIWLLSLIVYDLFLKKEIYHGYNRAYLLTTFLAGIFLPMWQWADDSVIYSSNYSKQVIKAVSIKQDIIASATPENSLTIENYLWYAYLIGVFAGIVILAFEVLKIVYLYDGGKKLKEGKWTVIETEEGHAPFSIFNYLFVDSKAQYTAEQWQIILTHEGYHSRSLHFIDQLLMQTGKIIFWFNPFVYVFNNRLLLVHEYQADKTSAEEPKQYGQFLIEQAMLHTAPALSHSFNRSPIKKRIIMLTKKSSTWAIGKKIIGVPLIIICILCFTNNVFSDDRKREGDIISYKGNKIKIQTLRDTATVVDPKTGQKEISVYQMELYASFNDRKIYRDVSGNGPAPLPNSRDGDKKLGKHLLSKLKREFEKLDDGIYELDVSKIIVDENGNVVYFEIDGFGTGNSETVVYTDMINKEKAEQSVKDGKFKRSVYMKKLDARIQKNIEKKAGLALEHVPKLKTLTIEGKTMLYNTFVWVSFEIKNHKITVLE